MVIIYLCGSKTCFEKKPNIEVELSGTRRFFEVFSPTQTNTDSPKAIISRNSHPAQTLPHPYSGGVCPSVCPSVLQGRGQGRAARQGRAGQGGAARAGQGRAGRQGQARPGQAKRPGKLTLGPGKF